jgi:hypothetical protein
MATKTKRRIQNHAIKKAKDTAPNWTGCETWSDDQFHKFFKDSMDYYRLEKSAKDLKPEVLRWMSDNDYTNEQIKGFKDTKDNRCSSTVGSIAANLNRGMTAQRDGFNQGRDTSEWLKKEIAGILEAGKDDFEPEPDTEKTVSAPVISIQDRMKEAAARMVEDIEDALENFRSDPEAFDPKQFKVLNLLKGKQAKAAHSRIIKGFYEFELAELEELASGGADEQLKEGYSHLPRKHVKKLIEFYKEIESACDMLAQEQKVNRKPRAKKAQPKEKVVAKIKYLKTHEPLKLVSINPTDIIGAKELWIYNVKTRKLGKYVSAEYQELGVKGASIINFDGNRSTQKTLRKPEEKIKEFKAAGKVQLRKFLEDINSVESKMNGRLNEQTILLKVQ